jgi:hypothetical protein
MASMMRGNQTPKGWQSGRTVGRMVSGKQKGTGASERSKTPNKNARTPSKRERFPFGKYRPDGVDLNVDGSWKKV